jgi:L,D-transpeptidase catalytic domain
MDNRLFAVAIILFVSAFLTEAQNPTPPATPAPAQSPAPAIPAVVAPIVEPQTKIVVSIPEQKLGVLVNNRVYRTYRVSTSRFGEGDSRGSWQTPMGHLLVANKIGATAPLGAVFRRRHFSGEVLSPNAPGRDPIVSRIIWLRGLEGQNRNAYNRCIYIHGTPQEDLLGKKASYGCIRMRSSDVIELFRWTAVGMDVAIVDKPINRVAKELAREQRALVARNIAVLDPARNAAVAPAPTDKAGVLR